MIMLLFLPLYLLFKLLRHIKGNICRENLNGKVVLITGASSGIGEVSTTHKIPYQSHNSQHLAYEYARRGARLALAARREDRLQIVAKKARNLGSSDAIVVRADVSRIEDCKRFVDEAVNHFGQVDHLINNDGIVRSSKLEDSCFVSDSAAIMDINFWGAVYCSHFAIPHLKKSKGTIVGIASIASWLPIAKMSLYNASKAALASFYETLRVECGLHVGVTIVTPGLVQSEITKPEFLSQFGLESFQIESTDVCAKAIVDSACRGDLSLIVPSDCTSRTSYWVRILYPELVDWFFRYWQRTKYQSLNKDA